MSLPRDLTAIVESVARDLYSRSAAEMSDDWDDLDNFAKHLIRERVLPIVAATVRAIDQGDEL